MEYTITTRVDSHRIWNVWEQAHKNQGHGNLVEGQLGVSNNPNGKGFKYQIIDVVPGSSFSIVWKTLFVRLVFTHVVRPTLFGSQIGYSVQIKGLFAWPIRFLLGNKIRHNLGIVLKAMVKQLESASD